MTKPITNTKDLIDSRDVIERLAELAGRWQANQNDLLANEPLDDDETLELTALTELAEQGEGIEDWTYGVTLIRDSYFEEYAQDLAEDIGAISSEHTWPTHCIDWEWAARELRMDYTSVDFDGVTYWARA